MFKLSYYCFGIYASCLMEHVREMKCFLIVIQLLGIAWDNVILVLYQRLSFQVTMIQK